MANTSWQISGEYFETCSCDYLCPCIPSSMAAKPTQGWCDFAMVFHIDKGNHGSTKLDGLTFVVIGRTPDIMGYGNWEVGLITDARATKEQQDALVAIGSGQGGGPMASAGPLVSKMLGVEAKPIQFEKQGMTYSISIPGVLDQAAEGVLSPVKEGEPLYIENTVHPANARLALAKATKSHLHVFGIDWDDVSGNNNGHFAPFKWQS